MKKGHKPDYIILFCLIFLVLFGIFMLSSASSELGQQRFGDSYHYFKHQIFYGISFGVLGFLMAYYFYYGRYKNKYVSIILLVISIALLLAVFTPLGITAKGATRWLSIGGFSFQPSEFLKLSLVMYLAIWLSKDKRRQNSFKEGYLPFLVILGVISFLLVLQRSTSPIVILSGVALIMYFISGARWRYILLTIGGGLIILSMLIASTPYRLDRVTSFLHPEKDPRGSGYHLIQSKTAIGSGGLFGVGYGQSIFTKVQGRLPEPIGDSIFAVIAEEFGFVGSTLLLGIFTILILRILLLAKKMRDQFGQLLLVGFASVIALQTLINVGAMSGILPLTGTPLPFISFGGTALAIFMTMGGIIVNISKYS